MEKNCLIVGRNSFIAKHTNFLDFDRCSYDDLEHRNLKDYDVIVNCALHPLFKTQPYREEIDIDFQVGKKREFWKPIHLYAELRPGVNINQIAGMGTSFSAGNFSNLGLRFQFK